MTNTEEPKVIFEKVKTIGDYIDVLTARFTGDIVGEFILADTLKQVIANNKKIEEFKLSLLKKEVA
jgi:hypothetical protein